MATTTYEPIQSEVLGSAAANVTFSSIPQGYTDLVLVINGTRTTNNGDVTLRINSDTGSNYSFTRVTGDGSSVVSQRTSNDNIGYTGVLSNSVRGTITVNLLNYSSTNCYKTWLTRFAVIGDRTGAYITSWRSSSAITNIVVGCGADTFTAGSTFTLYGIANADVATGVKATGGIITYDDTYYYHTFGASGTFTPKQSLTADLLVVAGGGGGGKDKGGGGGAGGVCYQASRSLSATPYTVTVGAGGSGSTGYTTANPTGGSGGSNGSNSVFDTITSVGGGLGATDNTTNYRNGASGGSGGGATRDGTIGSATQGNSGGATGYGNNGGSGNNGTGSIYAGGGGGGAGAVGANAPTSGTVMASGGAGLNTWSSWLSVTGQGVNGYIAGGGGAGGYGGSPLTGGTGGSGGGGNAGGYNPSTAGSNAVTNTGSGGGGGGDASNAGNGGSGLIIVRYTKA